MPPIEENMPIMGIVPKPETVLVSKIPKEATSRSKKSISRTDVIYWLIAIICFVMLASDGYKQIIRYALFVVILFGLNDILNMILNSNPESAQRYIKKLAKTMPVFLLLMVISMLLSQIKVMQPYTNIITLFMAVGVAFTFIALQQYGHLLIPSTTTSTKLEDKIKAELNLHDVKHVSKSFPKYLNWIGGFMTPIFPFFTVVNKNWKKNLTQEAFIHENVHIHLMVYNGWSIIIVLGTIIMSLFVHFLGLKGGAAIALNTLIIAMILTMHERITFEKTKEIGAKFGVITRSWSKHLAISYMFIYTAWFLIIQLIFSGAWFIIQRWFL